MRKKWLTFLILKVVRSVSACNSVSACKFEERIALIQFMKQLWDPEIVKCVNTGYSKS